MEAGIQVSKLISMVKYGSLFFLLLGGSKAHAEYYVVYGMPQTVVVPAPSPCCRVVSQPCPVYHRPKKCGCKKVYRKTACYNPCKKRSCGRLTVYYAKPCASGCNAGLIGESYSWVTGSADNQSNYYEMSGDPMYTTYSNTYHHVSYDDRNWDMRTSDDIYY